MSQIEMTVKSEKEIAASKVAKGQAFYRLEFLDSLRAIAAFYVVFYHMVLLTQPNLPVPVWLQSHILTGGTGVTLFFLISAFSLCYSADKRKQSDASVASFYLRRFFRIAPLFYLMLLLYYVRDIVMFDVYHGVAEIFVNAFFVFNVFPQHMESYVWAGWTIGVEMIFYLIFPYLYRYASDIISALKLFLLANILSWAWGFALARYSEVFMNIDAEQQANLANFSFLLHFPNFALGILVYRFFNYLNERTASIDKTKIGGLCVILFCFIYEGLLSGRLTGIWSVLVWQGVAYSALIIGLGLFPMKQIVNKFSSTLGKMSFSLYLIHPTLVYLMSPLYHRIYDLLSQKTLSFLMCCCITVVVLAALSYIGYRYVERPGIRLGEWVIARLQSQNKVAVQDPRL